MLFLPPRRMIGHGLRNRSFKKRLTGSRTLHALSSGGDCKLVKSYKGVDWEWRTTIGTGPVLLLGRGPMVFLSRVHLPRALPQFAQPLAGAVFYDPFGQDIPCGAGSGFKSIISFKMA